jgi:hypothetical protein
MYRVWGRAFMVAVFVLMLGLVWSWGGLGPEGGLGLELPPQVQLFNLVENAAGNTNMPIMIPPTNEPDTFNTAHGAGALQDNTTGSRNAAYGAGALQYNTDGFYNTASGVRALQNNTTGTHNTAIGESAGVLLLSGHHNLYLSSPGGTGDESNTMRLGWTGSTPAPSSPASPARP